MKCSRCGGERADLDLIYAVDRVICTDCKQVGEAAAKKSIEELIRWLRVQLQKGPSHSYEFWLDRMKKFARRGRYGVSE